MATATRTRKQLTEEQKARAAERREKFRELANDLASWPDEKRAALADRIGAVVTVEGRALSFVNTLLAASQLPMVSMVGGFAQWLRAGRCVRKGEQGIGIWVLIAGSKPETGASIPEAVPTDGDGSKQDAGRPRFMMGTVFDISQTDPIV